LEWFYRKVLINTLKMSKKDSLLTKSEAKLIYKKKKREGMSHEEAYKYVHNLYLQLKKRRPKKTDKEKFNEAFLRL